MEQSVYKHPKLPTVKLRVNTEKQKVNTGKPRVNKLSPPLYTHQPAYTSTNLTNHADIFNIKPIYNHKYPTHASKKMDNKPRYPTRVQKQ